MIELTQTCLYPDGNCWQTAVACILDLDPEVMPPQSNYDKRELGADGEWRRVGPNYNNVLQSYLKKHHGLAYVELHTPEEALARLRIVGYHLITGDTVRSEAYGGVRHVVVGKDGEMVWDPHPSRAGLTTEIHWALLVPHPKSWGRMVDMDECVCPACLMPVT